MIPLLIYGSIACVIHFAFTIANILLAAWGKHSLIESPKYRPGIRKFYFLSQHSALLLSIIVLAGVLIAGGPGPIIVAVTLIIPTLTFQIVTFIIFKLAERNFAAWVHRQLLNKTHSPEDHHDPTADLPQRYNA